MKILIVSDSHGIMGNLFEAVDREEPDQVFHLGDVQPDLELVQRAYPRLAACSVAGNCDGWGAGPEELEVRLGGLRFWLTHGHRFQAKLGPGALLRAARERGVDAVLYGHTHEPVAQRQPDGLWLINPGTVGGIHNKATYGVALLEDGQLSVEIKTL